MITVREVVLDAPAGHLTDMLAFVERLTGLVGEADNEHNPLVENPRGVDLGVQRVDGFAPAVPLPARLELRGASEELVSEPTSGHEVVLVAGGKEGPAAVSGVRLQALDAERLAGFWTSVLDGVRDGTVVEAEGFRVVCEHDPGYVRPTWPTQQHGQMLHLDLQTDDLDAATRQVTDAGATLEWDGVPQGYGRTFADPEGHPFCLGTMQGSEKAPDDA